MPKKTEIESKEEKQEKETEDIEIEYLTEQKNKTRKKKAETKDVKLKKKEAEIKELRDELENLKQEYLRQAADKENLRKRLEKEKQDYYQYSLGDVFTEILNVLDNFERAMESESRKKSKSFYEGVEMIYKQLLDLLKKKGVKPIDIDDKTFNPYLHQAFITEESEGVTEPIVDEVFQRGYTLHDRLLRPSLVKVLIPKKE